MSYSINQKFIPGLPEEPYDNGHPIGVLGHATAVFGDTPDGERNYELTHWQDAFVHYFVGAGYIDQVADTKYVSYGAGHIANHLGYIQVELCQTTDPNQFTQDYAMYTWLLAKILYDLKLPINDNTLTCHALTSQKFGETNHDDPCGMDLESGYLGTHNKTWANVVQDVTNQYNLMEVIQVERAILLFGQDDLPTAKRLQGKIGNCAIFFRNSDATAPSDIQSAKQLFVVGGKLDGSDINHPNKVVLAGKDWFKTADAVSAYIG